jgi:hypothetical protein
VEEWMKKWTGGVSPENMGQVPVRFRIEPPNPDDEPYHQWAQAAGIEPYPEEREYWEKQRAIERRERERNASDRTSGGGSRQKPPGGAIIVSPGPEDPRMGGGRQIGLALERDLFRLRQTGSITYKDGAWQRESLTDVDWGKAVVDSSYFERSFKEAVKRASSIRFDLTSFSDARFLANRTRGFAAEDNVTNAELDWILTHPELLGKTTFVRGGEEVRWSGSGFVPK